MKQIRLIFLILIVILISHTNLHSQIQVLLQQPPPNQLNVADLWKLTLNNTSKNTYKIYLQGTVDEASDGRIIEATSQSFDLEPGVKNLTANNVQGANVNFKNSRYKEIMVRTGNAPSGNYTFCVYAKLENGTEIGEDCKTQIINQISPPVLILPADGDSLDNPNSLNFLWTAVSSKSTDYAYRLTLTEVKGNQKLSEAINNNLPIYVSTNQNGTNLLYPQSAPTLNNGSSYCWRIDIVEGNNIVISSTINVFSMRQPQNQQTNNPPRQQTIQRSWSLLNKYGIESNQSYYSGRLWDALKIDNDNILVSSEGSGVWWLRRNQDAISLSHDWDGASINSLAKNTSAPGHYFAGGRNINFEAVLWETRRGDPIPLFAPWDKIPLPTGIGWVRKILTLGGSSPKILLGTNIGVFWSYIPTFSSDSYNWHREDSTANISIWNIEEGPDNTIIVGTQNASPEKIILHGSWSGVGTSLNLTFHVSHFPAGLNTSILTCTSISVYNGDRHIMYAASSDNNGALKYILKSTDGGVQWYTRLALTLESSMPLGTTTEGRQGNFYDNCVAVSENNPDNVAVGWVHLLYSTDEGNHFKQIWDGHDDHVSIFFNDNELYDCNDGGLAIISNIDREAPEIDLDFNRNLPDLVFYQYAFDAFFNGRYIAGGGLQDHPAVYCSWRRGSQPNYWRYFTTEDFGDGGPVCIFPRGAITTRASAGIYQSFPLNFSSYSYGSGTDVNIIGRTSAENDEHGIFVHTLRMFRVTAPFLRDSEGKLIHSLIYSNPDHSGIVHVYGLFSDISTGYAEFKHIRNVAVPDSDMVSSVGSYDGRLIYVGFGYPPAIKSFSLGEDRLTENSTLLTLTDEQLIPDNSTAAYIDQIVVPSNTSAFATSSGRNIPSKLYQRTSLVPPFTWTEVSGLPGGIYITSIASSGIGKIFVGTSSGVFYAENDFDRWTDISSGLPKNPSITRLIAMEDGWGKHWVFAATWGWSVWKYPID